MSSFSLVWANCTGSTADPAQLLSILSLPFVAFGPPTTESASSSTELGTLGKLAVALSVLSFVALCACCCCVAIACRRRRGQEMCAQCKKATDRDVAVVDCKEEGHTEASSVWSLAGMAQLFATQPAPKAASAV
jgi:hypothetical protein